VQPASEPHIAANAGRNHAEVADFEKTAHLAAMVEHIGTRG
jgi:hypothetical protein